MNTNYSFIGPEATPPNDLNPLLPAVPPEQQEVTHLGTTYKTTLVKEGKTYTLVNLFQAPSSVFSNLLNLANRNPIIAVYKEARTETLPTARAAIAAANVPASSSSQAAAPAPATPATPAAATPPPATPSASTGSPAPAVASPASVVSPPVGSAAGAAAETPRGPFLVPSPFIGTPVGFGGTPVSPPLATPTGAGTPSLGSPPPLIGTPGAGSSVGGVVSPPLASPITTSSAGSPPSVAGSSTSSTPAPVAPAPPVYTPIPRGTPFGRTIVLSQRYEPGGDAHCGYHALKNALAVLAIRAGQLREGSAPNPNPLLDRPNGFFRTFHRLVNDIVGGGRGATGDIDIASLTEALNFIKNGPVGMIPALLLPLRNTLNDPNYAHSVSMFNPPPPPRGARDYSQLGVVGENSLEFLANIQELNRKPGPWSHAIVIGSQGHWVTLILDKTATGAFRWTGMDSWDNQQTHFRAFIDLLTSVINRPERTVLEGYENAIGEDFARKARQIKSSTIDPEILLKQGTEYENKINQAFSFMERVGWLTPGAIRDPAVLAHVRNLKTLINFYQIMNDSLAPKLAQITTLIPD